MSDAALRVTPTTAAQAVIARAAAVGALVHAIFGWCPLLAPGMASAAAPADPTASSGAPFLSGSDVRVLIQRGWLERDDARTLRILGPYGPRVLEVEGVHLPDVRIAHIEALECALGRVAARRLGVAQFFADGLFRGGAVSLTVLIDGETSRALERTFDLHTIFPAVARAGGGRGGGDGGQEAHMLFLVAGQGRLVMAYDRGLTYPHPDDAYSIFGNRDYHIYPFLRMTIGLHRGSPALLDIATADGPAAPLAPFEKRVLFLSPAIHSLTIHDRDVTADTSVIDRKIRPPPVEWRQGPSKGNARLRELGCPADGGWGLRGDESELGTVR
jgi:hypothetical protein